MKEGSLKSPQKTNEGQFDPENNINDFIDNLFPQVFSQIMEITSLKEQVLPSTSVLNSNAELLQLQFDIYDKDVIYQISYAAIGKTDRYFSFSKASEDASTDFAVALTDSPNSYFIAPLSDNQKSISTLQYDVMGEPEIHTNDFETYKKGIQALLLIGGLRDAEAVLL